MIFTKVPQSMVQIISTFSVYYTADDETSDAFCINAWLYLYFYKAFDLMYIMTSGGPYNSTDVLGTYAYSKAFTQYEFSQGSAIAMVLFVCLFLVGLFYLRLLSKEDD